MEETIIELKSLQLIDRFGLFLEVDKDRFLAEIMNSPNARGFRVISNKCRITSDMKIYRSAKDKIEYYLRGVEMTAREIVEHRPISKRSERVLRQILLENAGQEDKLVFIYCGGSYYLKKASTYTIAL